MLLTANVAGGLLSIFLWKESKLPDKLFEDFELGDLLRKLKYGFTVFIANTMVLFIVNVDKNILSFVLDSEKYAIYSFGFVFLVIIRNLMVSLRQFIFPSLSIEFKHLRAIMFERLTYITVLVLSFLSPGLFLMKYFIEHHYAKYTSAIVLLPALYGTLMFESVGLIVHTNYYQLLKEKGVFFYNTLLALIITYTVFILAVLFSTNIADLRTLAGVAFLCGMLSFTFNDLRLRSMLKIRKAAFLVTIFSSLAIYIVFSWALTY